MPTTRQAKIELSVDDRGVERGLARSKSSLANFNKSAGKSLGNIFKMLGGGALLGAGVGAAGIFGSEAVKTLKFEESLTRLQIAGGQTAGQIETLRDSMFRVSDATGVAREDILAGVSSFVALTGDAKGASEAMDLFAKVQRGTGASMDDIAASAAAMQQNLHILPADMEQAFSILVKGGKAGAIELKDVAGLLAELAPLAAQFSGGLGTKGLADLGAGLQLARQGFGSASEAATGLEALMGGLVKHADRFRAGGVNIFTTDKDGAKHLKSFQEIVEAIGASKLVKDPTALTRALGSKEAYSAFIQLTKVKGAWSALSEETLHAKDVSQDFNAYQQSSAGQMSASWNELKNQVAETFTPERIRAFSDAIGAGVALAGKLIEDFGYLAKLIDDLSGGNESAPEQMHGDDLLQKALASGLSLDQVAAGVKGGTFANGRDGITSSDQLSNVPGIGPGDFELLGTAVSRRRKRDKDVAAADFKRFQKSPDLLERESAAFQYNNDLERLSTPEVKVHVLMDPSTTDLKGKQDNHRSHLRR